jgi:hypothetical protein
MIVPLLAFPCPPPVTPQTPGAPLDAYKSVLGATEGFIIMDCFFRRASPR